MSDHKELEQLIKSLSIPPNEDAKQKAKALFLQKAEKTKQLKYQSNKKKTSLLHFVAGMAAMLILVVSVLAFYYPSFQIGTMTKHSEIIQYRIFPAGMDSPTLETSQKYLAELSILHTPGEGKSIHSQFLIADGRTIDMGDDYDENKVALFSILKDIYGFNPDATKYSIPDYSKQNVPKGYSIYITRQGTKPRAGYENNAVIKDELQYIPVNLSEYTIEYGNSVCYGEIVLLKAPENVLKQSGYIPCRGQTLSASEYPVLAKILEPGKKQFTLPDLTSPIEGAVYCIANTGDYPYIN